MRVSLIYRKIEGVWEYDGFQRKIEPSIPEQKAGIKLFMETNGEKLTEAVGNLSENAPEEIDTAYVQFEIEDGCCVSNVEVKAFSREQLRQAR